MLGSTAPPPLPSLKRGCAPNASYLHQWLLWSLSVSPTLVTYNISLFKRLIAFWLFIQACGVFFHYAVSWKFNHLLSCFHPCFFFIPGCNHTWRDAWKQKLLLIRQNWILYGARVFLKQKPGTVSDFWLKAVASAPWFGELLDAQMRASMFHFNRIPEGV